MCLASSWPHFMNSLSDPGKAGPRRFPTTQLGWYFHASNMLSVSLGFKHVLRAGDAMVSKTTGVLGLREVGSLAGVTQLLKQWNCDVSLQDVSFSHTIRQKCSPWAPVLSPLWFLHVDISCLWRSRDKSEPAEWVGQAGP